MFTQHIRGLGRWGGRRLADEDVFTKRKETYLIKASTWVDVLGGQWNRGDSDSRHM